MDGVTVTTAELDKWVERCWTAEIELERTKAELASTLATMLELQTELMTANDKLQSLADLQKAHIQALQQLKVLEDAVASQRQAMSKARVLLGESHAVLRLALEDL